MILISWCKDIFDDYSVSRRRRRIKLKRDPADRDLINDSGNQITDFRSEQSKREQNNFRLGIKRISMSSIYFLFFSLLRCKLYLMASTNWCWDLIDESGNWNRLFIGGLENEIILRALSHKTGHIYFYCFEGRCILNCKLLGSI